GRLDQAPRQGRQPQGDRRPDPTVRPHQPEANATSTHARINLAISGVFKGGASTDPGREGSVLAGRFVRADPVALIMAQAGPGLNPPGRPPLGRSTRDAKLICPTTQRSSSSREMSASNPRPVTASGSRLGSSTSMAKGTTSVRGCCGPTPCT